MGKINTVSDCIKKCVCNRHQKQKDTEEKSKSSEQTNANQTKIEWCFANQQ